MLEMNKNFSGRTIITKDQGMIGNWLGEKFSNLQNIKLEDPQFEKIFEVYGSDQVESRYLLTTAFMERITKLNEMFEKFSKKRLFGKDSIKASFFDRRLLIAIPCDKNLFESSSIFKPAVDEKDVNIIYDEIRLIIEIIDVLKLNLKTGL